MNNSFNFNRFWLLVKRQWLEFGKIYLISLLVVVGVLILFYAWNLPEPEAEKGYRYNSEGFLYLSFRIPLFLTLGFIFISVIASGYFSLLGQKPKAIIELMTPASTLEKWLCSIFYTGIFSVFSFLLVFYITDLAFVKYIDKTIGTITFSWTSGVHPTPKTGIVSARTFFNDFFEHDEIKSMVVVPFMITSIFLLGSVYFNRFHYIKTAVVVMLFLTALIYTLIQTANWMTRDKMQDSANFGFSSAHNEFFIYAMVGITAVTVFLWCVTFFRVKEKEV
ncbi:hypothetical protein HQN86_16795 [Pedobacter panaciterrae]|jgi:hypothetical protein|uniref:hypothetical protein n=1 Tax=Pedobacter panaciterrae TaxID=363849 RepID=UPI00155DD68C|nr:hypothetical protein [Pedobacter panaciterrae]NQX55283.1 hypothetical protein [Pedobacter panaciterrae]